MTKNTILFLFLAAIIASCASYKAQYKEDVQQAFPTNAQIEQTFYLIGDVGKSPIGGKSEGLLALESHIKEVDTSNDRLIFLGDNIYPTGLPEENAEFRPLAENHLNAQIEVAKQFKGKTTFIPGNHDWYEEGLPNVQREKDYIEKALNDKDVWQPKVGCPLETIDIGDDVFLMIIDSQWYLEKWDNHPTINDNCDEIKTRRQLFLEIEGEFKKNQDKTILVALHHPLYTNGVHGGQYAFNKHLFPTQRKLPLPILASLTSQIRTSGGVSAQDKQNQRYQSMVKRITTLAKASQARRIIFASGHEHSLQYIENDGIKQIVSGSGSKKSYASLSNDGLFAYGGKGFARMDVLKDGSTWVRYYDYVSGEDHLLYTVNAIKAPVQFDMESLPDSFNSTITTSVYNKERTEKSALFETVWGNKYRDLYGTEVNVPVAVLDTLYGGLEVVRAGGGHQTRALRLKDKNGKEYNLRALKKSAVQFLQTTVFKENDVVEGFEDTATEDILYDFYTAAHPYAMLIVPGLADALDIYHTNPEIYYVPKQKALGKYNPDYGDELYMIVERPEENHGDLESFGKPDDIESTSDVLAKLREDEKYKIDEGAYIKARMFDMLIGDWDRHQDQWRWSQFKQEDGSSIFKPIPRDRDQVFSNFDGALFGALRTLISPANQFATYSGDLTNTQWFNAAAIYLDRSLAQNADKEDWLDAATFIKENLTDAEIEAAFKKLPVEIYPHESTQVLLKALKERRDNMPEIAMRYYKDLSELAIVTGTDKDDFIDIERTERGLTKVSIYRNKGGERAEIVRQRTFNDDDTDEIWIYALDDDDVISATGDAGKKIKVRVIGGQNNDIYDLEEGKNISLYDHKSKDNTVKNLNGARLRLSDKYTRNLYDPRKNITSTTNIVPAIGFNPDDGLLIGLSFTKSYRGFNRNPNTRTHRLRGGYYFATQGFDLNYTGEFAGIFNNFNLIGTARFAGPNFAENFFGIGNETVNNDDDEGFDFNRVRISEISAGLGLDYNGEYGSNVSGGVKVQGFEVEDDNDRFISDLVDPDTNEEFYERQWFVNTYARYNYESYDVALNPTRGMIFDTEVGGVLNTEGSYGHYIYIKPKLGFYNALSRDRKFVLKTTAQGQINIGNDYQFYQFAQLGQDTGLRGYRNERFTGQRSFAGSADVRYSFDRFKTGFVPLQMGIFIGGDVGRVWVDGEGSSRYYNDFGGGFWINSTDAIGATFNAFAGDDGLRFSFQVGFSF